jgi:hypothetical protein
MFKDELEYIFFWLHAKPLKVLSLVTDDIFSQKLKTKHFDENSLIHQRDPCGNFRFYS